MTDKMPRNGTERLDDLTELKACLEAFGAELSRWPGDRRAALQAQVARSAQARQHVAEAKALDAMLERAPLHDPSPRFARLEDTIVAAAVSERAAGHGSASGNVVPMRASPAHPRPTAVAATAANAGRTGGRTGWRAGALLAASLVAGVIIGISEPGQSTMSGVMSAVSASASWEGNDIATAIQSDALDALEETL